VPTPTDGNRELLTVIGFMRAAPGKREELKAALAALTEPASQEDGYVNYHLHQGVEDAGWLCRTRSPWWLGG